MLNFRNVVTGETSGSVILSDDWPELGKNDGKSAKQSEQQESAINVELSQLQSRRESSEFPELNCSKKTGNSVRSIGDVKKVPEVTSKPKKKRAKFASPLQIDICEIIQACASKKKQKLDISALKKTTKFRRKIISGNPLDSDQPVRHKGKRRPWKPRIKTKTKQIFCASKSQIRIGHFDWPLDVVRFKTSFGAALKRGEIEIDRLVDNLTHICLEEPIEETTADRCEIEENDAGMKMAKRIVHNKKFRSYCNNVVTKELKTCVSELIDKLRKFQDRLHARDEIKAHAKRRYVCGFNESTKFLLVDRVKMLIVATNMDAEEGLPSMDILKVLLNGAKERNIPVIFAGLRREIGFWSLKKANISVLAVMSYEGADDIYAKIIKLWGEARAEYDRLLNTIVDRYLVKRKSASEEETKKEIEEEIKEKILEKLKS